MVQLVFAARDDEQVVVETLKSPVAEIEMPVRATLCLLDNVNTLAAPFEPTLTVDQVALAERA